MAMPARISDPQEGFAGKAVHETPLRREHDVVHVELLQGVLQVVLPRLRVPVVGERDRQSPQAVDLRDDVKLERRVLPPADGDDAVVVVPQRLVVLEQFAEGLLPLRPVDADLLLGRLAGLADPHLVELDPLVRRRHAAPNAIGHPGEKGFPVGHESVPSGW